MVKIKLSKVRREDEVRKMIERGLRQHEIAERLGVSLKTVSNDARKIAMAGKMVKEQKLYAESIETIKALPAVKFAKTSRDEVANAIMDTMQALFLEFKRRLPIMSNEEIKKSAMKLLIRDDDD